MKAIDLRPGMHIVWRVPGQAPVSAFVRAGSIDPVLHIDCSDRTLIIGSADRLEAQGMLAHAERIMGPELFDPVIVDSPRGDGTTVTGVITALSVDGEPIFRLVLDAGKDGEIWDLPASYWGTRIRPKESK